MAVERDRGRGIIAVNEGPDGSGKGTQTQLAVDHLRSLGFPVETVDFPQYDTCFFGKMVGEMMNGKYGPLSNLDPHLASLPYTLDRWKATPQIKEWLNQGKIIIANRYVCSNMGHQTTKVPESERDNFLAFLEQLEYEEMGIPREDLVIFLHVPPETSQQLVLKKKAREHLDTGKALDLHEADINHLRKASETYLYLVRKYPHWARVDCCDSQGNLMTPEAIHEEVMKVYKAREII